MSQRGVEQTAGTILATGIELTDQERKSLGRIRPGALAAFQRYLEGKRLASIEDVHRS